MAYNLQEHKIIVELVTQDSADGIGILLEILSICTNERVTEYIDSPCESPPLVKTATTFPFCDPCVTLVSLGCICSLLGVFASTSDILSGSFFGFSGERSPEISEKSVYDNRCSDRCSYPVQSFRPLRPSPSSATTR